jgi:SAM-dependent methyltransferase
VSYYHHLIKHRGIPSKWSFEQYLQAFNRGKPNPFLPWGEYYQDWASVLEAQVVPTHLVRYENLLETPDAELTNLLEFMGVTVDSSQLEHAIAATSLAKLQDSEQREADQHQQLASSDRSMRFFRNGESDQWHDYFSQKTYGEFLQSHGLGLKAMGYHSEDQWSPHVVSPLTGKPTAEAIRTIPSRQHVKRWSKSMAIEVEACLDRSDAIHRCRCLETGLEFYRPVTLAGDGAFYEQLAQFGGYYQAFKWEHRRAMEDISEGAAVLEIGCGPGGFLSKLAQLRQCDVAGVEINPQAIEEARRAGLRIHNEDLYDFAEWADAAFDVVCAFQVLEHIAEPGRFLDAIDRMARPGATIILAVPNQATFLRHDRWGLLNTPPHHMSHWTSQVFEKVGQRWGWTVERVVEEPLAAEHAPWFMYVQLSRMLPWPLPGLLGPVAGAMLARLGPLRTRLKGHTLYACFRKPAAS